MGEAIRMISLHKICNYDELDLVQCTVYIVHLCGLMTIQISDTTTWWYNGIRSGWWSEVAKKVCSRKHRVNMVIKLKFPQCPPPVPSRLVTPITSVTHCCCCKWSSGGSGLLQKIIRGIRPLAIDHPEDPANCKWSSRGSSLLQMIIWRIWSNANNHVWGQATCKWSSRGFGLLQMIIWRIQPLANDHLEHSASFK